MANYDYITETWSVWVGGIKVNDTYLSFYEAYLLGMEYRDYDDVFLREER